MKLYIENEIFLNVTLNFFSYYFIILPLLFSTFNFLNQQTEY